MYKIAYGESRKSRQWINATISWDKLRERLVHPLEKEGIVGTFCRAMGTIENSIDKYLDSVFLKSANFNHLVHDA